MSLTQLHLKHILLKGLDAVIQHVNNEPQNQATWFVYMLRCADQSLYTGVTTDIQRRLAEHNQDDKKGAKYTRADVQCNWLTVK